MRLSGIPISCPQRRGRAETSRSEPLPKTLCAPRQRPPLSANIA